MEVSVASAGTEPLQAVAAVAVDSLPARTVVERLGPAVPREAIQTPARTPAPVARAARPVVAAVVASVPTTALLAVRADSLAAAAAQVLALIRPRASRTALPAA